MCPNQPGISPDYFITTPNPQAPHPRITVHCSPITDLHIDAPCIKFSMFSEINKKNKPLLNPDNNEKNQNAFTTAYGYSTYEFYA